MRLSTRDIQECLRSSALGSLSPCGPRLTRPKTRTAPAGKGREPSDGLVHDRRFPSSYPDSMFVTPTLVRKSACARISPLAHPGEFIPISNMQASVIEPCRDRWHGPWLEYGSLTC